VKKKDPPPEALRKRSQPGRVRAVVLAVAVHLAFLALIIFGVTWQSRPTAPVMAELWDKLPTTKQVPPPPQPAPQPQPQPQPPKEEVKPPPPQPDAAEIAEKGEREKRRQELERLEKEREEQARVKREQEEAARKLQQQQEEAARKKQQQEEARKKREEEQRRKQEELARQQAEQAAAAAATARQIEMQKYVDRIKAKILGRANVPDTVATGTELTVHIRILPGGDVLDISVTSSTSPIYAAAIERAIRSAEPLPVPAPNSELFPQFRDLTLNFRHER